MVGSPVVGAVRMVTAANLPREIVANVFLGERLRDEQDGTYSELGVTATREHRPTKEYPKGQEVYSPAFDQAEGSGFDRQDGSPDQATPATAARDEDPPEPPSPDPAR